MEKVLKRARKGLALSKSRGFTLSVSKGFTLIELLVVIGIIGILATVTMVNLSSGRDKAKASSVLQSLRSAFPSAAACLDAAGVLKSPAYSTAASADVAMCTVVSGTNEVWPNLLKTDSQWDYNTTSVVTAAVGTAIDNCVDADKAIDVGTTLPTCTLFNAGKANGTNFNFSAAKIVTPGPAASGATNGLAWIVSCNQKGCDKAGF